MHMCINVLIYKSIFPESLITQSSLSIHALGTVLVLCRSTFIVKDNNQDFFFVLFSNLYPYKLDSMVYTLIHACCI